MVKTNLSIDIVLIFLYIYIKLRDKTKMNSKVVENGKLILDIFLLACLPSIDAVAHKTSAEELRSLELAFFAGQVLLKTWKIHVHEDLVEWDGERAEGESSEVWRKINNKMKIKARTS